MGEARKLAATATCTRRGARAKRGRATDALEEIRRSVREGDRADHQTRRRRADITNRLISAVGPGRAPDPQDFGKPTEFAGVSISSARSPPTRRGRARGLLPPTSQIGNPPLLPTPTSRCATSTSSSEEMVVFESAFTTTATNTRSRTWPTRSEMPVRGSPPAADSATAPGWRDASATSNAATRLRRSAPERRRRPPDLGRLGNPHLQREHLHHPPMTPTTGSRSGRAERTQEQRQTGTNRAPTAHRRSHVLHP